MKLPSELILEYFTKNLYFTLGSGEKRGLELFFQRAAALRLVPESMVR